jgi:hypothetical protein
MTSQKKGTLTPVQREELRKFLIDRFSLSELKGLAFDLCGSYELFPHRTSSEFVPELILYFERRRTTGDLIAYILKERPDGDLARLFDIPSAPLSYKKAQLIIQNGNERLHDVKTLLDELARELGVDEIEIIAIARGTIHLLISIPVLIDEFFDVSQLDGVPLGAGRIISASAFDSLDLMSQQVWRIVACEKPPVLRDGELLPTISWSQTVNITQGDIHATLSDPRRAILFYKQHLAIAREIFDRQGESKALTDLGKVYYSQNDYRRSIQSYEQALTIMQEISDQQGKSAALVGLGNVYRAQGDFRRAIQFYAQDLSIAREIGDQYAEGNALNRLGSICQDMSDNQRAIEFYEQSFEIARQIGDHRVAGSALFHMSLSLDQLGERERAIELARSALEIFEHINSPSAEYVRDQLKKRGLIKSVNRLMASG